MIISYISGMGNSNARSLNNFISFEHPRINRYENRDEGYIYLYDRERERDVSSLYSMVRAIPKIFTCPSELGPDRRTRKDAVDLDFPRAKETSRQSHEASCRRRTPESSAVTNPNLVSQPPVEEKGVDLESTVCRERFFSLP